MSGVVSPFSVPFMVESEQRGASEQAVTEYSITLPYGEPSPSIMDLVKERGSVSLSVLQKQFHFRYYRNNFIFGIL